MIDPEKVIRALERCAKGTCPSLFSEEYMDCEYTTGNYCRMDQVCADALELLKDHNTKQYSRHEVACIIADLFGEPCACNFNNIDEWLPYKCDFRDSWCPNPVGVACWEQYLKYKKGK